MYLNRKNIEMPKSSQKQLYEYQVDEDIQKEKLEQKVIEKLQIEGFEDIDIMQASNFVNDNFDLLTTDIDTISPEILLHNFQDYIQKVGLTESIRKILTQADEIKHWIDSYEKKV